MNAVHDVDLNLWVVLARLFETSSVSEAARRLGRTQSAVSHSLASLRELFGDPLFVRVGARLEPTPRARELEPKVRAVLSQVDACLQPGEAFDPAQLKRTFRIFLSDFAQVVLLGPLLTRVEAVAPQVRFDVTFRADAMDEVLKEVRDNRVDMSVGPRAEPIAGVVTQVLFEETNVCVVRRRHPFARRPTAKKWAALRHIVASPRGLLRDFVDDALEREGLSRTVVARVPHFTAALSLVERTDAVTLVPRSLAEAWGRASIAVVEPPLPLPGFSFHWYVSELARHDPASSWLRAELKAVAQRVFAR